MSPMPAKSKGSSYTTYNVLEKHSISVQKPYYPEKRFKARLTRRLFLFCFNTLSLYAETKVATNAQLNTDYYLFYWTDPLSVNHYSQISNSLPKMSCCGELKHCFQNSFYFLWYMIRSPSSDLLCLFSCSVQQPIWVVKTKGHCDMNADFISSLVSVVVKKGFVCWEKCLYLTRYLVCCCCRSEHFSID